jgi:flagellar hook-associated protein 2
MGITPLAFTGISSFSDDFQVVLDRAVAIANIPIQQLQNEQADLISKKQLLSDLRSVVEDLGDAIQGLGQLGSSQSIGATSSKTNRVTVTNNGANLPAIHTISEITSVAKAASERSLSGFATAAGTAVSADGVLELVIGSTLQTITLGPGQNNLNGLRDAINTANVGVSATVLDTGTPPNQYYLSLTATSTGATTLQLRETAGDAGSNLLTATNQGADAIFKLDGLAVSKKDNVVSTAIPGMTFTIVSQTDPGETVTLTLATNRFQLSEAIEGLVSSYNAVVDRVNAQVGTAAGMLSGDPIIAAVQRELRGLVNYQGTGAIKNLVDLGIELDSKGKMSFDTDKFDAISLTDMTAAFTMLGSTTTGLGGLWQNFDAISDPLTGMIQTQQTYIDATDADLTEEITKTSERVTAMQLSLMTQLQAADTLLARLESQQSMLDASIQGLELALYGKSDAI